MAQGDRLLAVAQAKVILPAAGAVWAVGDYAHAAHASMPEVALGGAVAALAAYATRARPLTVPIAVTGAWLAAAARYGPLADPRLWCPLTITWAAAALAGLRAAHRHPSVQAAKRWRAARLALLAEAHKLGIGRAHLVEHEETRLGERWVLDTTGTGRLASQIAGSGLAERIAQSRSLPRSRVHVSPHRIAGKVEVSIQHADPWKHPIPHPLLCEDPELDLPVPCTITKPFPVGQDPETGAPLNVTLWDDIGAKVVMVIAKRGGGKDVLLSCIRERVTAAEDADLWGINVSKAPEDLAWQEATERSAIGPEEYKKACQILKDACDLIATRWRERNGAKFVPSAANRVKVIVINEADALFQQGNPSQVKAWLRYIASKGRSEGVVLVFASQRAVAYWIGGTDVRANIDYVCVGKVRDPGEVNHAVGQLIGATLPDMSAYGEGHPGVWVIVDDGGNYAKGRSFCLDDLDDVREIARERSRRVPAMAGGGGLPPSNLPASNHSPGEPPHNPPDSPGDDWLSRLDDDVTSNLPDDLRDQLAKIHKKNARTREILAETAAMPPPPEVDQEASARSTAERWRQVGEQAVIPPEQRQALLDLVAGEGTTTGAVADAFKISKWTARTWLEKLRQENIITITGKGRGARWVRTDVTGSDDG